MWGHEVSACQTCGRASFCDPCRICQHDNEQQAELEEAS